MFGPVEGPLLALLVPSAIISCTGSAGRRPGAGPVRRAGAGGGALRHPTHQPPGAVEQRDSDELGAHLSAEEAFRVGGGDRDGQLDQPIQRRARDPARLTRAAGDDPRSLRSPPRCGAGAQPRTLVIRQIRETLLAARLQGGSSMAGARPHRRRRAAASGEGSCLGEQRERSIVPALMWPGRRFRPPLAAAAP